MRKRIVWLLIVCITAIFLAACSGNSVGNSENMQKQSSKTLEKVKGVTVKSEQDIMADLEGNNIYTFFDAYCVDNYGNFTESDYSLQNLEITRRKVDKDAATDDVYITLSAKSESCSYTGSYHLSYSLYDVGGWYLEDIELERGELEPLAYVSEDAAHDLIMEMLHILGADASDVEIFNEFHPTPMEESLAFKIDFNDGVLAVSGGITLTFQHDGRSWNYVDYTPSLRYDILLDGTYQNRRDISSTTYLTFTHQNGSLEVWMADSWDGGIDPFHQKDWTFDPFTRSFETESGHYFFDYDGLIYSEAIDVWWGAFTRISDPITDVKVLDNYLTQAKIPRQKIHYEQSQIVHADFIPSTRPGEFPQLAPLPLPDQPPQIIEAVTEKSVGTSGLYDDIMGTYIDENGDGTYMFIGYGDSSKATAYIALALAIDDFSVEIQNREGNIVMASDFDESVSSEPGYAVDLDCSQAGKILAGIYINEYDYYEDITFVPYSGSSYANPYYIG